LLKWFESFLVGRTQYVQFNGARSELVPVTSGVVQGSVLGPLMYIVFTADIPECVQYADDATKDQEITSPEDVDTLQAALDDMQIWCDNNGMTLNPKKCKVMDITHASTPLYFEYTIGGVPLEYVDQQRVLGVHITCDLKWTAHTKIVRGKAAQTLGFAARNLRGCTPRVKRMAYQSLVKPIMTYGLPAWHPDTISNVAMLDGVQKRALHFIHGRQLPPVSEQKLMPINMHLQYADLVFFKRCLSGATDFNVLERITEGRALRGDDPRHPRLQQPATRTVFGRDAYSYRVVTPWNNLPAALKDCQPDKFPKMCADYLWSNL
jgi:hypothetical protein